MNDNQKNIITSIVLSAELLMYGHISLRIDDEQDGLIVKWMSITDGGEVVTNAEKRICQKRLIDVVNGLCDIDINEIEENGNIYWSLQFFDKLDNVIDSIEVGYWEQELLENIINELRLFLEDGEALVDFYNILE